MCCDETISPLASYDVLNGLRAECNPTNKDLDMWVNEYLLNKLQTGPKNIFEIENKANSIFLSNLPMFINDNSN
jgi:hypothetical protein